jgi:heme oxygenase
MDFWVRSALTHGLGMSKVGLVTTQVLAPVLMARLRAETRAQHHATEAIPFSAAIVAGSLPLASYAAQLAAYVPVHEALESTLQQAEHAAIARVWDPSMRRVDLLRADLRALGSADAVLPVRTAAASDAFAAWIEGLGRTEPAALLGVLYVLEGSTLGGALLRTHLAATFSLTDAGLRYYAPYGTHPKPHWVAFSARMNEVDLTDAEADAIVEAARETFDRIGRILVSIGGSEPAGSAA